MVSQTHPLFPNVMILEWFESNYEVSYEHGVALYDALSRYVDSRYPKNEDGMTPNEKWERNQISIATTYTTKSYKHRSGDKKIILEFIAGNGVGTVWRLSDRLLATSGVSTSKRDTWGVVKINNLTKKIFPSHELAQADDQSIVTMAKGILEIYCGGLIGMKCTQKFVLGPVKLEYEIVHDKKAQKSIAFLKKVYKFGSNPKIDNRDGAFLSKQEDADEFIQLLTEQVDSDTNMIDSVKQQIKQIMRDIVERYLKTREKIEIKTGFWNRLVGAIFGSGEGVENDILYPEQNQDGAEEIAAKNIYYSEPSIGKVMAKKAMVYIAAYGDFAQEYPLIAEYGFTATSGVLQTIIGGGLPGLLNFVRGEIQGAALNQVMGDKIQAVIENITHKVETWISRQWDDLTNEENESLASTIVIGTLAAGYGAATAKSYFKATLARYRYDPTSWRDYQVKLSHHEGGVQKGHTIERHVKVTEEQMHERLQEKMLERPNKPAKVTRFTDLKTAEDAITQTIKHHKAEIDSWIKNPYSGPWSQKHLEFSFNHVIGHGITSNNRILNSKYKVQVTLVKTDDGKVFVKTAYPIE